jgi:dTDP-glucose 4,6-dehydratase
MRIVVTGGAGFIGSAFINYLKSNYQCDILCIDKLTYAANKNNIKHQIDFLEKDICEVTANELGEYDYLVNFAAETHVDNSILNGQPFIRSNVEGTFNLLECARQNKNIKKFIQISTDEVYGDMQDLYDTHRFLNASATESSPLKPSSYYSATKASADLLVISANRTFGLPYLITRTCNNFGEHQNTEKFLPKIYQCIQDGIEVPIYGNGTQVREWIYVNDNVKILVDLMLNDNVINNIYNISSGIEYTNMRIINMIGEILGKEVKYKFVPDRLGHDRAYRIQMLALNILYNVLGINKKLPYTFLNLKDYLTQLYK